MRRTKEEAAITREKLLASALTVFSRDGYAGTRLDEIAELAEVSKGAIFHHFGSKAGLFNELVAGVSQRYSERFVELQSASDSVSDVLRRLLVVPVLLAKSDATFRAVQELLFFKTAVSPELEEGMTRKVEGIRFFLDEMTNLIQAGIEAGEIRSGLNPRDVAVSLYAQQSGLLILFLLDPESVSTQDQIHQIADIFIQGISTM